MNRRMKTILCVLSALMIGFMIAARITVVRRANDVREEFGFGLKNALKKVKKVALVKPQMGLNSEKLKKFRTKLKDIKQRVDNSHQVINDVRHKQTNQDDRINKLYDEILNIQKMFS